MDKKYKVLELFAGIGAFSKALDKLGIEHEIVDAVEIDKYAVKSFNAIQGTNFEPQDITTWDKDIDVDIIVHGSPCQDISLAGLQKGADEGSGTRSSLMYESIRIIDKLKPKYVIWENVKNLISKKHFPNFQAYITRMSELGYKSFYKVLNAKDFGVPQNRERVYTISILEEEGKDINFEFPTPTVLKTRLKDLLDPVVDEKYYLSDKQIERIHTTTYTTGQRRIQEKDWADTLCARDWKDPKCVKVAAPEVVRKYGIFDTEKSRHQAGSVYDQEGISPTLDTMQGGWRQPCIEIKEEPEKIELMTIQVPQIVRVRKYPVNIEGLKETLRTAKADSKLSNKDIAEKLSVPMTKVEHWFRTDNCFAIPDENLWFSLKDLLNIETYEFDKSIMTFEEREGVYEKGNRYYDENGLAPTVMSSSNGEKILTNTDDSFISKKYNSFIDKNGYVPEMFNPYNEAEILEVAPTQTTQAGSTTSSATVLKAENIQITSGAYARSFGSRGKVQSKDYADTLTASMGTGGGNVPLVPIEEPHLNIKNNTKQGYIEAYDGDGVDISGRMEFHRGTVQEQAIQTLDVTGGQTKGVVLKDEQNENRLRVRKLTPKECWRLMSFEDSDFEKAEKVNSATQLYKQAGNSIVVDVLARIVEQIIKSESDK